MNFKFNFASFLVLLFFSFINPSKSSAQGKGKETYIFHPPDFHKKQKGNRVSDGVEFILYDNKQLQYTELYRKGKSIWFIKDELELLTIDKTGGDTLAREEGEVITIGQNNKYQWVLGEGTDYGYFYRKGQLVLSVHTVNKHRKCTVSINYNEREPNIEVLKALAIYKAHKDLSLNHKQKVEEFEDPLE